MEPTTIANSEQRHLTQVDSLDDYVKAHDSEIRMNEVIRCYECRLGHQFVETVKKKEPIFEFPCPACKVGYKSLLEPIIVGPPITIVRGQEPTTLGQVGERNCKKLSKYRLSEERQAKKDARKTWYNPNGEDLSFINKMTDKEKRNYIVEGDRNGK